MIRRYSLIFLFIPFIFLSCKKNTQERKMFYSIQAMPSIPLKGEEMAKEILAPYTKQMRFIQSRLFHFTPIHETVCLVTNEHADTIGYFGNYGNGPGELNEWPYFAGVSLQEDTIYMYDQGTRKLFTYQLKVDSNNILYSFIKNERIKEKKIDGMLASICHLERMTNGYSVGFRLLTAKHTFTLFNKDLEEIETFGDFPIAHELVGEEPHFIGTLGGSFYTKGNSFYYAIRRFGYMARYDINNGNIIKVWDGLYSNVNYRLKGKDIKFNAENQEGFYSIAVGEKYIFASYSGERSGEIHNKKSSMAIYPQTLVVLDLNGKPLGKFKLNSRFVTICLDEKEEYLYIQHEDPDTSLWRYKISDIIKYL